MADETDGVAETFDQSLRMALTIASQFGERISRLREQFSRQREADAHQEARELQARFDAERSAARAQVAVVNQPEWWTRAGVDDIAAAHETATAWRDHDDVAAAGRDTVLREVRDRYGIDVDAPGADPGAVADALRRAEADRARAAEERRRAGEELTASEILLASADARDRDADSVNTRGWYALEEAATDREYSAIAYDTAERRRSFAQSLEGTASQTEVAGRVLADTGNAKHPREAVTTSSGRAPKARRTRAGLGHQRDRGGLAG